MNHTVNVRNRDIKKPLGEKTLQEFYDILDKEAVKISKAQMKFRNLSNLTEQVEKDKLTKIDLSWSKLNEFDVILKQQSFLGENDEKLDSEDENLFKKLKDINLYLGDLPNLQRWFKTCKKIIN